MKYTKSKKRLNFKNNFYDVENIITRRIIGKKVFYLIKWKGYPINDCSWEPISNLYNVIYLVNKFNENYPNSIEEELLKKYYNEFKKYKNQKLKKKKKNNNLKLDKIIIPITDIDLDCSLHKEEKKEEKEFKIEANNICENNENINNENESNKINTDTFSHDSIVNNMEKLIWPIIIW